MSRETTEARGVVAHLGRAVGPPPRRLLGLRHVPAGRLRAGYLHQGSARYCPRPAAARARARPQADERAGRAMVTDQALAAACPQCGAEPGERCRPAMGVLVHAARVEAWRAAEARWSAIEGADD